MVFSSALFTPSMKFENTPTLFSETPTSKCKLITSNQLSFQPSNSFGCLSVFCDFSSLSVDYENLRMNVSGDLFSGSNIHAYIAVSCETVVKSGTNLTWGIVGKLVPDEASASGGTGSVQSDIDGATLGVSLYLDSKFIFALGGASVCLKA